MVTYLIVKEKIKSEEHKRKLKHSSNPNAVNLLTGPALCTIGKFPFTPAYTRYWWLHCLIKKGLCKTALLCLGVRKPGTFYIHRVEQHRVYKHQIKKTYKAIITEHDLRKVKQLKERKEKAVVSFKPTVEKAVEEYRARPKSVRDIFETDLTNAVAKFFGDK